VCEQKGAAQIDSQHLVEILATYVLECLLTTKSGIVHKDVDWSQSCLDDISEFARGLGQTQIGVDRNRSTSVRHDLGG
jgi:hypothetical protein